MYSLLYPVIFPANMNNMTHAGLINCYESSPSLKQDASLFVPIWWLKILMSNQQSVCIIKNIMYMYAREYQGPEENTKGNL